MTVLLGGAANPLGAVVQWVEAGLDDVVATLARDFAAEPTGTGLLDALRRLLPFESPWSRLLVAPCSGWTVLVDNGLHGGDSTAPGPAVSNALDVGCVVASAVPRPLRVRHRSTTSCSWTSRPATPTRTAPPPCSSADRRSLAGP